MKVLYTANVPSPYRMDFFNELGRYCELTVLFETDRAADRDEKWITQRDGTFHAIYMKQMFRRTDTAFCPEVISCYKKSGADILVVGGYSTPTGMYLIQYLRRHKIPFLLNCDGGLIKNDAWLKKRIKTFFISSAAGWLSTGRTCSQYLLHYGAESGKIVTYPFTSTRERDILKEPMPKDKKQKLREQLGMQESNIIISVGQFIHRKGYDVLLEAMKEDNETGVYIIGGKPLPEYLEIQRRYGMEHLHFVEFKTREELKDYYSAADLFVLPTREDIWGLVINEAMAYGLPVVTTNRCVAGQELIENGRNGYLVDSDNPAQLREKIAVLLKDENLRIQMQKQNLHKIRDYTIEKMVECHLELFSQMIKEMKR